MKSKYLINFDKSEEPLYREAIRRFGHGVYIDSNAYWKDGHKDNNAMALKCIEGVDLRKFWKIVDQLKCSMKSDNHDRNNCKMNEKYVISVKTFKDVLDIPREQWRYASNDDGAYGSGYPCWAYSEYSAKTFTNIEDAEKWFKECKRYLFGIGYKPEDFDISTLAIRKITYKKVVSLKV